MASRWATPSSGCAAPCTCARARVRLCASIPPWLRSQAAAPLSDTDSRTPPRPAQPPAPQAPNAWGVFAGLLQLALIRAFPARGASGAGGGGAGDEELRSVLGGGESSSGTAPHAKGNGGGAGDGLHHRDDAPAGRGAHV